MRLYSKLTRRAFFYLIGLLATGISTAKSVKILDTKHIKIKEWNDILREAKKFPFMCQIQYLTSLIQPGTLLPLSHNIGFVSCVQGRD